MSTTDLSTVPHRVLRASAGAGKTYQLTGHYLDLLEAGAAPESILATTFTRKAAGEIFARVMTRLADGAETDPAARERLLGLARHLDRVAIGTLDSFFSRLGNAFRFELDLPPDPQVVGDDSPIAQRLRQRAIAELIDEANDGGEGQTEVMPTASPRCSTCSNACTTTSSRVRSPTRSTAWSPTTPRSTKKHPTPGTGTG